MKKEIIMPFDLAKAKAGAKLRTKGGYPVEIFKWVARGNYPIRGIIIEEKDDMSACWKLDGSWIYDLTSNDLVIVDEIEEPEFKVGDWVVYCNDDVDLITGIDENGYSINNGGYIPFMCARDTRLWTIKDAKDGDVLVASDGSIFLFKGTIDCACKHYVALTTDGVVNINEGLEHYWETSGAAHPATKEERDTLFVAMKEAGYEWDADALELKKIKPKLWSDRENKKAKGYYIDYISDIIAIGETRYNRNKYNLFATKKQAKSALAMARISQIMANDIENFGGVITDEEWNNAEWKIVIYRCDNQIKTTSVVSAYHFLAFHTEKQRDLFLEKYPQLVKDYLMIPDEETK